MERAVIYARISQDPRDERLGVKRQEEDLRREAERRGAELVDVLVDNDISASGKKVRPSFDRLIELVKNREVDLVLSWDLDRLQRNLKDYVRLYETCEGAGITVGWLGGEANFATGLGVFEMELRASFAREELRKIRGRIRRKHLELAKDGKVSGGGRPFGYESDRRTVRPEEAELIKEAAQRVLRGESLRSVVMDWNDRGVSTVRGAPAWSAQVLRRLLVSGRISGRRDYSYAEGKRLDIGRITCETAEWPAIISKEASDQLRSYLGDSSRKRGRGLVRQYLLTGGLARCGLCNAPLQAHPRSDGRKEMACVARPGRSGCGRIGVLAQPVEELVSETVLQAIDRGALAKLMHSAQDQAAAAELRALEAKLAELARDWATDRISRIEWDGARSALLPRQQELQRRIGGSGAQVRFAGLPDPIRPAWPSLSLQGKRAVIAALVDKVVIAPARPGLTQFDPGRVSILWHKP